MEIRKRPEYDRFRCIAGACPDSCCKEWEVEVDATSAARYQALEGPLGDKLRQVMRMASDGSATMVIEDGRCPMWQTDGLCRIQRELGAEALCDVCGQFPRLRHDYGSFVELGLEMSCPEAARLILNAPAEEMLVSWEKGGEAGEYDKEAMQVLLRTRRTAYALLREEAFAPNEALALLLIYGYQAQEELDGQESMVFDADSAMTLAQELALQPDGCALPEFFAKLEILTPEWENRLAAPFQRQPWPERVRLLARYFVDRYWLQAISDYDLVCRVKLTVALCALIWQLGGDLERTAQLCSKEIENNADNVETILDGAYTHPALTDRSLLGILLKN